MKAFSFGMVVTLVALVAIAYIVGHFGLIDTRADQTPSKFETSFAMAAMDASTERHAPKTQNPVQPADANLREGMTIYTMNCALCHGDPKTPESPVGASEYPPAPQFLHDPADMPENQNFYIIKHGVRLTAMPGWERVLNDDQIWKVTTFLSHMEKLPPAIDQEWKGTASQPGK